MNSTVGFSSLHHGTPLKVLGRAIFDIAGLTHQGELGDFWRQPGSVDAELYQRFRTWLEHNNQANGNFYKRLPEAGTRTGVRWFAGARR
jgi:capsule polysaccharide modification protein KpsS